MKLRASYKYCRLVVRKDSPTLYFATRLLRQPARRHLYATYTFFKTASNIAYQADASIAQKSQQLHRFKNTLKTRDCSAQELLWPALFSTVDSCDLPNRYLDEFIGGLEDDIKSIFKQTRSQLIDHCCRSFGAAAIASAYAIGVTRPKALAAVKNLGIAIRLTHIMRDIGRDYDAGRIYLPSDDLKFFGVKRNDIEQGSVTPQFVDLMKDLRSQAMGYYHDARDGIKYLPAKYQRPARVFMRLNLGVLRRIEEIDFNVYNNDIELSFLEKVIIILNTN